MNRFTFTKLGRTLLMLLAVAAVGSVCWLGCGGDDNPNNGGGSTDTTGGNNNNGGGTKGGSLVLGTDEAWVDCDENSDCEALVFTKDGKVYFGGKEGDGDWVFNNTPRQYSTSGNKLTISLGGDSETATYSISGNKLTINSSTYTKTSGVKLGLGGNNTGGNNTGGSNNTTVVDPSTVVKSTFTDSRNNKTYKTVKIGNQTWMAENLNYNLNGSWCYENNTPSCNMYGKLYDWSSAMTVCPSGWHLPSNQEWKDLKAAAGSNGGKKLKAKSEWKINDGTDVYGFSALPGGGRWQSKGSGSFYFGGITEGGYWWAATEVGSNSAYRWNMDISHDNLSEGQEDKSNSLSVRCLKDVGGDDNPNNGGGNSTTEWGAWTVTTPATCDAAGVETRTDKNNPSNKETRAIPKLTGAACETAASGTFTDSRDGKKYKKVTIGILTWMAENLNYEDGNSWCFGDSAASCAKYGRLYDWETALTVCPTGWHLSTRQEWTNLRTLANAVGTTGFKVLIATSGWRDNMLNITYTGTDDFGFTALPGGWRSLKNDGTASYANLGGGGFWWTDAEQNADIAYSWGIRSSGVGESNYPKDMGLSVRCVADAPIINDLDD